jgi:hypothetical protein
MNYSPGPELMVLSYSLRFGHKNWNHEDWALFKIRSIEVELKLEVFGFLRSFLSLLKLC